MGRCIVSEQNERTAMNVDALPKPTAPALQKETTVGNYFVSNYPPFSFWKPDFVPELHAALERPPERGSGIEGRGNTEHETRSTPSTVHPQLSTPPFGLYVHIPFAASAVISAISKSIPTRIQPRFGNTWMQS